MVLKIAKKVFHPLNFFFGDNPSTKTLFLRLFVALFKLMQIDYQLVASRIKQHNLNCIQFPTAL